MSAFDELAQADVDLLTQRPNGLLDHLEFWHLLVCPECGSWSSENDQPCDIDHALAHRVFVKVIPDPAVPSD